MLTEETRFMKINISFKLHIQYLRVVEMSLPDVPVDFRNYCTRTEYELSNVLYTTYEYQTRIWLKPLSGPRGDCKIRQCEEQIF